MEAGNLNPMEEEQRRLQEVKTFVKNNLVVANNDTALCGDGRPVADEQRVKETEGAIREFGADLGFVFAVASTLARKKIDISAEEVTNGVIDALLETRGEDSSVYYHTDEESEKKGTIGCGHAARITNIQNESLYAPLTSDYAKKIYDFFISHPKAKKVVLRGGHEDHKEEGVLLVESKNYNLSPQHSVRTTDGMHMFFVADLQRQKEAIGKFFPIFAKKHNISPALYSEEVVKTNLSQMTATESLLAKGLPQFMVKISETQEPEINFLSNVS